MAHRNDEPAAVAERFRVALDLYETGEAMMRQRIRRQHPDLAEAEIELRVAAWLQSRQGAQHGDASGRPAPWPRARLR